MTRRFNPTASVIAITALGSMGLLTVRAIAQSGQNAPATAQTQPTVPASMPAATAPAAGEAATSSGSVIPSEPLTEMQVRTRNLLQIIDALQSQVKSLRIELANESLAKTQAQRELDELRQFIADHREFGQDFEKYKAVREIAERREADRRAQEARERREAERADREARRQALAIERAKSQVEADRVSSLRRAGFSALGLDVFASRMSFYYETREVTPSRIAYDPLIGHYTKTYPPYSKVDYSSMTISGSVLNGSDETRDIGVAITFFDENGKQVGNETVKVNNARPNVPYPFTSKISMALDRPFDSSSIYVLYADPVDDGASAPAAPNAGGNGQ